jgi:acid stress-induced BolA-like protein IbaG/YrbA
MRRVTTSQIESALTAELHLKEPRFRLEKYGTRIFGSVISPTFKRKNHMRRHTMIFDALEKVLGSDGRKGVTMILAYTPDEWNSYRSCLKTVHANGKNNPSNGRAKVKSGK